MNEQLKVFFIINRRNDLIHYLKLFELFKKTFPQHLILFLLFLFHDGIFYIFYIKVK